MHTSSQRSSVFFGRKRICALLEKRLEAFCKGYRQNVGIVGPSFIGKSTLVQTFLKQIGQAEIIPIFFSCREFDSFERFSERWMGELLFSFHHAFGKSLPPNFQLLVRSLKEILPKTLERMRSVKKLVFKRRYDQAFQELLNLSSFFHQECGRRILVVLDDFDRLGELKLSDPFHDLGKEIMVQKETMFIVTSSRTARSFSIFREKLSLLFGNFEVIELGPFDFDESRELIDGSLSGQILEDELKRFLIRITDGHPYYLDFLLDRFKQCAHETQSTNREIVIETLMQELSERRGMLYQHFQLRLYQLAQGRPRSLFADVLLAISLGHKKLSQIIRFLHQRGGDTQKILERLLNSETIQKHGSLFQIPDSLFRFWLGKVYYRERFLSERAPVSSVQCFRDDISQAIDQSSLGDKQELPRMIEELFLKFRNDVVELNKQKFKCPHFTEVLSRPTNGRVFPIFARNTQTRWLCQVLSRRVMEDDIHMFIQDLKCLKESVHKKLIIGLQGIDLNAKLLAQEAKIQYLDLRGFNFLLDLYGKPKLVV